jgi:hypothetical protein
VQTKGEWWMSWYGKQIAGQVNMCSYVSALPDLLLYKFNVTQPADPVAHTTGTASWTLTALRQGHSWPT